MTDKLEIVFTVEDDALKVLLHGRIDSESAPVFKAEVEKERREGESVIIDLAGVDYISSAGLRALLMIQNAAGGKGKLKVIGASNYIRQIFVTTGFDELLIIGN